MKYLKIGIAGIVLQAACLAVFIIVSRTSFAAIGKPVVIALTLLVMGVFLWRKVTRVAARRDLFVLSALLALGYAIAFHLVGAIGFPGLLRDLGALADYFVSVMRVTAIVFLLYAIGAWLLYLLNKALNAHKRRM